MGFYDTVWPRVSASPEQEEAKAQELHQAEALAGQTGAIEERNVDIFYDSCVRVYGSEEDRRRTVETRATALLGGLAILSALVVTFGPNVIRQFWATPSKTGVVIAFLYSAAAAYFSLAIWRTLQAFKVDQFHVLVSTDLEKYNPLTPGFKRRIAGEILLEATRNGPLIDRRFNKVSEAFLLLRNGVVLLLLLGVVMAVRAVVPWTCQLGREGFVGCMRLALCPQ